MPEEQQPNPPIVDRCPVCKSGIKHGQRLIVVPESMCIVCPKCGVHFTPKSSLTKMYKQAESNIIVPESTPGLIVGR